MTEPAIAILLPAHDEAAAIQGVIAEARAALPGARIVVCDNNSSDDTAALARAAGAEVLCEPRQGKGAAVRRLFADIEADIYVMADADGTYDLSALPGMVRTLREGPLDMVAGARAPESAAAHPPRHALGNEGLKAVVRALLGGPFTDIFTGCRVFSRRFVKSFPATVRGFDIETAIAIHALEMRLPCAEAPVRYRERPEGGASKLRTFRDGGRIALRIVQLLKDSRPVFFYGVLAALLALASAAAGAPVVAEYLETGLVERLPTAILATGLALLSGMSLSAGLVLDTVRRASIQSRLLAYLAIPAPPPPRS
jgi:glycosyltransferase involved in cell wall biosynthesis